MILESKENEIIELQNKLEKITKEHDICQKPTESSQDQLKSVELESAASGSLLEQEDNQNIETTTEISKRLRSKRNLFKYQMKHIQVN